MHAEIKKNIQHGIAWKRIEDAILKFQKEFGIDEAARLASKELIEAERLIEEYVDRSFSFDPLDQMSDSDRALYDMCKDGVSGMALAKLSAV